MHAFTKTVAKKFSELESARAGTDLIEVRGSLRGLVDIGIGACGDEMHNG
jgi:hypothetical protein